MTCEWTTLVHMNQTIELRWTPERKDWVEAIRAVSWLHRWSRVLALLAVVGAVSGFWKHMWALGSGLLVAAILLFVITDLQVREAFRRNPRASKQQSAVLDDDGVHVSVDDARTDFGWHAFHSWREISRSYLLRLGKTSSTAVLVIPKRALGGDAAHTLTELLTTHVGDPV